jgi:hypothetical protein
MKKLIVSLAGLFAVAAPLAFGQGTVLVPTTLSAAVTKEKQQQIVVTSATGILAPTLTPYTGGTVSLYIDKELFGVESVNGTTITVVRGQGGTTATKHPSGAYVWVAPSNLFFVGSANNAGVGGVVPQGGGACTRSTLLVVPSINVETGVISDCLGGQWVNGVRTTNAINQYRLSYPQPGAVLYTAINTSGTAVGATTLYCTEVDLPYNKLLTGIGVLNGTTVTANARYVVLYDSSGIALANSALAGQASVTASIYEAFAFTSKFYAVGPAQYFGCMQDNAVGSTTVRMAVTGVNDNELTKGQTGATFGTIPVLVPPTAFATAVGPYIYLY